MDKKTDKPNKPDKKDKPDKTDKTDKTRQNQTNQTKLDKTRHAIPNHTDQTKLCQFLFLSLLVPITKAKTTFFLQCSHGHGKEEEEQGTWPHIDHGKPMMRLDLIAAKCIKASNL